MSLDGDGDAPVPGIIFDTGGFKHEHDVEDTRWLPGSRPGRSAGSVHAKVLHERTQGGLHLLGEVLGGPLLAGGEIVVGVVTEKPCADSGFGRGHRGHCRRAAQPR